jgi:hypothetical protein
MGRSVSWAKELWELCPCCNMHMSWWQIYRATARDGVHWSQYSLQTDFQRWRNWHKQHLPLIRLLSHATTERVYFLQLISLIYLLLRGVHLNCTAGFIILLTISTDMCWCRYSWDQLTPRGSASGEAERRSARYEIKWFTFCHWPMLTSNMSCSYHVAYSWAKYYILFISRGLFLGQICPVHITWPIITPNISCSYHVAYSWDKYILFTSRGLFLRQMYPVHITWPIPRKNMSCSYHVAYSSDKYVLFISRGLLLRQIYPVHITWPIPGTNISC